MKFTQLKNLNDYKVTLNDGKLIGWITELNDGWYFKPESKEFIGIVPDKTLIQAKKRAMVFFENNKKYFLTNNE